MQQMFAEFQELKRYVDGSIHKLQRPRKRRHNVASDKMSAETMLYTDTDDTAASETQHHG